MSQAVPQTVMTFPDGYPELLEQMGQIIGAELLTLGLPLSIANAKALSITNAIRHARQLLAECPWEATRQVIDVSGDGTHNAGRGLLAAREDALAQGVTINGLVILSERPLPWNPEHTNPPGGLAKYYQDNVIGGPGAFVMVAENFQSFGQAIISKLIAEIASAPKDATGLASTR